MEIHELLTVTLSKRSLNAEVTYKKEYIDELKRKRISKQDIIQFLKANRVTHGLIEEGIEQIVNNIDITNFPIRIAVGYDKEDGKAGSVHYDIATSTEVDLSFSGDFRDVMRLPMVEAGMKIATLNPPTSGKNGMTVTGKEIKAKQGKPVLLRAGKNIRFNENNQSYYALENGLVNFGTNVINIYTVYEVNETISMRTGNIHFNGSVIIRGDVPSGFSINATGDVKVFGLVEAANIKAGGSVYVSEGLVGLKKGIIKAAEDVFINYVNQGIIKSGRNLQVENSILHSNCSARRNITCHQGNIIGGTLFAGRSIEAKDIGNHMHTTTALALGIDNEEYDEKTKLEKEKTILVDNMNKIKTIRNKMKQTKPEADAKIRINLLKLTNSYNKMSERLLEVEQQIDNIRLNYDEVDLSDVKITGTIYPNTTISFGKYQRRIDKDHKQVVVKLEQNDIIIEHYSIN